VRFDGRLLNRCYCESAKWGSRAPLTIALSEMNGSLNEAQN
jgi:hypothetical protein